jgi:hypothetical protein
MTEEEAKTKWCVGPSPSNTGISITQPDGSYRYVCSGSACMAWRWEELGGFERLFDRNTPKVWVKSGNSTTDGHCGLAGKP